MFCPVLVPLHHSLEDVLRGTDDGPGLPARRFGSRSFSRVNDLPARQAADPMDRRLP